MRQYKPSDSLSYFAKYRWYLRSLHSKKAERAKILADINEGNISRDILSPDWNERLLGEIRRLKRKLADIEFAVESIPETPELIPCKLFLRLHFISGMTLTQTADKMDVSLSTLRRIRDRASKYFDTYPL